MDRRQIVLRICTPRHNPEDLLNNCDCNISIMVDPPANTIDLPVNLPLRTYHLESIVHQPRLGIILPPCSVPRSPGSQCPPEHHSCRPPRSAGRSRHVLQDDLPGEYWILPCFGLLKLYQSPVRQILRVVHPVSVQHTSSPRSEGSHNPVCLPPHSEPHPSLWAIVASPDPVQNHTALIALPRPVVLPLRSSPSSMEFPLV